MLGTFIGIRSRKRFLAALYTSILLRFGAVFVAQADEAARAETLQRELLDSEQKVSSELDRLHELGELTAKFGGAGTGGTTVLDERRARLHPNRFSFPILAGDPVAGKKLFESERLACAKCHRVGEAGGKVGPELTRVGAEVGPDYLLESVLDPSGVIVQNYREAIVLFDESEHVRGVPIAWLPDKDRPRSIRLGIVRGNEVEERTVELAGTVGVGDVIVGLTGADDELELLCGEHVSGDEGTGVTLRVVQAGGWVERRIEPDRIEFVNLPRSPMPENFADLITPRELYDLVAFLAEQKP